MPIIFTILSFLEMLCNIIHISINSTFVFVVVSKKLGRLPAANTNILVIISGLVYTNHWHKHVNDETT